MAFWFYFGLSIPASLMLVVLTTLLAADMRWLFLPRQKAGIFPLHGVTYCRTWLLNRVLASSLDLLHGVYASIFASSWLRLMGARVGRHTEVSTAMGIVPDLLTLGDDAFIADGVMLGDEEQRGGWMMLRPTGIGNRSFVGNGAYVADGAVVPDDVLIGVQTRTPENHQLRSGQTWMGSPPLLLPAREQTAGFPDALTFRPSGLRKLGRAVVEAFRIVTPHAAVIAVGYTVVLNVMPLAEAGRWGAVAWLPERRRPALRTRRLPLRRHPQVAAASAATTSARSRCGRPSSGFRKASPASTKASRCPISMRYLRGTPWLPVAFNLLGSRIGRGAYLDTTDFTEFDCVHIGDHSELNALCCPQTHLFEDRVMKIDHVRIGQSRFAWDSKRGAVQRRGR